MPAGTLDRTSPSSVAATPASGHPTPDKPRTLTENRKSSKPIMEKRRRARINESLGQLKTLILAALKKDTSRHSKLEKADILEMTVKHLRNLQRLQMTAAVNTDPSVLGKYRSGFSECVGEVTRFLSTCEGVNTEVRTRLLGHLAACVTQISAINLYGPHPGTVGQTNTQVSAALATQMPCKSASAMHVPPEAMKLYGGFQVVPMPDGQFTFLVPSAALVPVSAQSGHHVSPVAPPVTSDSVWRPW
ncbi:putative transcription factor HES-1-B-like [Scophthalmus maximus]|uniref:Putative transcription factor HES-1-B-like n=1 Tax=Scophthalmus maximus TaxID=52904 RepID=A0A2U9BJX0_SCOMX|nr:transcription factor HES-1-like [Scophthalmus maximus]AWP04368.1 putative transcription factor HES-1-B-like [Scophthalmus maximus]